MTEHRPSGDTAGRRVKRGERAAGAGGARRCTGWGERGVSDSNGGVARRGARLACSMGQGREGHLVRGDVAAGRGARLACSMGGARAAPALTESRTYCPRAPNRPPTRRGKRSAPKTFA
eukprot:scaffold1784_cov125-Isochrysis_galbana.AAC.1